MTNVQRVLKLLTYSEEQALKAIVEAMAGQTEVALTASQIADMQGVTRSTVVQALRMLEAGGIVQTRSMGAKGTYIRVLVPELFEAVKSAA